MTTKLQTFPPLAGDAWIAQHRAQLALHVAQCGARRARLTAAQCLDALHAALGTRLLTTACLVSAVMLLASFWH